MIDLSTSSLVSNFVPPERFELSRPYGHLLLRQACLPFHQGGNFLSRWRDSNPRCHFTDPDYKSGAIDRYATSAKINGGKF